MITIPSAYLEAERRRARNAKLINCGKLVVVAALLVAIITCGVLA